MFQRVQNVAPWTSPMLTVIRSSRQFKKRRSAKLATHGTDTLIDSAKLLNLHSVQVRQWSLQALCGPRQCCFDSDGPFNVGAAVGALNILGSGSYVCMNDQSSITQGADAMDAPGSLYWVRFWEWVMIMNDECRARQEFNVWCWPKGYTTGCTQYWQLTVFRCLHEASSSVLAHALVVSALALAVQEYYQFELSLLSGLQIEEDWKRRLSFSSMRLLFSTLEKKLLSLDWCLKSAILYFQWMKNGEQNIRMASCFLSTLSFVWG